MHDLTGGSVTDVCAYADDFVQGEENPQWTANRVLAWLGDSSTLPVVDLSQLEDMITIFGNFEGASLTPGVNVSEGR